MLGLLELLITALVKLWCRPLRFYAGISAGAHTKELIFSLLEQGNQFKEG
ncbi:hypothetical protein BN1002_01210 [Bacillus sp. B-jedd]|nr:hypothetical protein BN1002_01210 [Bacillus sp. B-jedd]